MSFGPTDHELSRIREEVFQQVLEERYAQQQESTHGVEPRSRADELAKGWEEADARWAANWKVTGEPEQPRRRR